MHFQEEIERELFPVQQAPGDLGDGRIGILIRQMMFPCQKIVRVLIKRFVECIYYLIIKFL